MGTSMIIGSGSTSIALLQERFKKLERVRERREEKELLNLFCSTDKRITSPTGMPRLRQQQLHQLDQETQGHDPLSLELGFWKKFKHEDNVRAMNKTDVSCMASTWFNLGLINIAAGSHESCEVDATLRL